MTLYLQKIFIKIDNFEEAKKIYNNLVKKEKHLNGMLQNNWQEFIFKEENKDKALELVSTPIII